MAARNSLIGSPIRRLEDRRFVQGRGEYVGDIKRPGMLHAVVLRSAVAHGTLRGVDAAAARALSGVRAVITAADLGPLIPVIPIRTQKVPSTDPFRQPPLAHGAVRYVGEPVALVVADTVEIANDAAAMTAVDIEMLPAVVDRATASAGETLLFDGTTTNVMATYTATLGDADAAFRDAPYVRRERFSTQRHLAVPMEPRGLLAEWDSGAGRLTVMGAAKVAFANRKLLAQMMSLPEDAIDMVENDVGGGFGVRGEFYPEDFLIPFAARRLGRPVRWIETRSEHMMATNHAREVDGELEIACSRDGRILGLRGATFVNIGAYIRPNGLIQPRNIAQFIVGPYRIPNVRVDCAVLATNKTPCGTYRAPGRFESSFFCERLLDIAANELGLDRVEFRRRNLVTESEIPHAFPPISPPDGLIDPCSDSGDYRRVLDQCVAEFDWAGRSSLDGTLVDGRYHGLGVGCFVEGGGTGPKENARLVLEPDGDVSVYVGSSAIGQGVETAFAQIAADALELPLERIRGVHHGSTSDVREGFGSFGSRATIMGGSAIVQAAGKLKAAMIDAAACRFGIPADDLHLAEGVIRSRGAGRSFALAELAEDRLAIEDSYIFTKPTYAFGAAAAHVAVDPDTGSIEVLDYLLVEDVGRIVNPLTLHGQAIGALVQGLGGTVLEHSVYDQHGQLLAGSIADYAMPIAGNFPNLRVVSLELKPSPTNPLGIKGAGEGGVIVVGGVIANAVASALRSFRVAPNDLPLSPLNVWRMIERAKIERAKTERAKTEV
jgi:carbon-monoxide dehydrogenase large subunit